MKNVKKSDGVTAEDFVHAWQTSGSVAEVAEKTGLEKTRAIQKAGSYRAKGIPLKKMQTGKEPIDVSALTDLAKSLTEGVPQKRGAKK